MRVLLVEDDNLELKALDKLFSYCYGKQFEVLIAANGTMALDRLRKYPIDLVILDINLPDMSGLDVLHTITTDYPQIRVIMATAYSDYEHLRQSLRDNAFDYLIKPYSLDDFKEAIARFLQGRNQQVELFGNKKTAQQILQYMEQHYGESISLGQLAELVNYDKSYIGKLFKNEYGMSIFSCLLQIRIKKAQKLLQEGMNVNETARTVGIEDPAYFGKCFKQIVGVSPQQYTKR